jgi:Fic family protein
MSDGEGNSTATASRDLKKGLETGFFTRQGDKKTTIYKTVEAT